MIESLHLILLKICNTSTTEDLQEMGTQEVMSCVSKCREEISPICNGIHHNLSYCVIYVTEAAIWSKWLCPTAVASSINESIKRSTMDFTSHQAVYRGWPNDSMHHFIVKWTYFQWTYRVFGSSGGCCLQMAWTSWTRKFLKFWSWGRHAFSPLNQESGRLSPICRETK